MGQPPLSVTFEPTLKKKKVARVCRCAGNQWQLATALHSMTDYRLCSGLELSVPPLYQYQSSCQSQTLEILHWRLSKDLDTWYSIWNCDCTMYKDFEEDRGKWLGNGRMPLHVPGKWVWLSANNCYLCSIALEDTLHLFQLCVWHVFIPTLKIHTHGIYVVICGLASTTHHQVQLSGRKC